MIVIRLAFIFLFLLLFTSGVDSRNLDNDISQQSIETATQAKLQVDSKDSISEILNIKKDILGLEEKLYNITYFKNSVSIGFAMGFALVLIASFFTIGWATKEVVNSKLEKFTGIEKAIISRNLKEFDKHNIIRNNSKIYVISKDNSFDPQFLRVMRLFEVDLNNSEFYLQLNKFEDLLSKEEFLMSKDLIVIENNFRNKWTMDEMKNVLITLSNKICAKTSIVYFGDGNFPIENINDECKYLISFVKAPSQLYGNLLNMLKFRNELGIKA